MKTLDSGLLIFNDTTSHAHTNTADILISIHVNIIYYTGSWREKSTRSLLRFASCIFSDYEVSLYSIAYGFGKLLTTAHPEGCTTYFLILTVCLLTYTLT